MFSMAPNIVLVPNMTQNAERKHRTQNTNTAHIRLRAKLFVDMKFLLLTAVLKKLSNKEQFLCVHCPQTGLGVPHRTLVFITNPNLITVYNNIMYTQSNISN